MIKIEGMDQQKTIARLNIAIKFKVVRFQIYSSYMFGNYAFVSLLVPKTACILIDFQVVIDTESKPSPHN